MSRAAALGSGGAWVEYLCRCIPFITALGGYAVVVVTELTNIVTIGRMVNLPVCNDLHFCLIVGRWMREELALFGV